MQAHRFVECVFSFSSSLRHYAITSHFFALNRCPYHKFLTIMVFWKHFSPYTHKLTWNHDFHFSSIIIIIWQLEFCRLENNYQHIKFHPNSIVVIIITKIERKKKNTKSVSARQRANNSEYCIKSSLIVAALTKTPNQTKTCFSLIDIIFNIIALVNKNLVANFFHVNVS